MAEGVRESDFEYDVVKSLGRFEEYTPLDRSLYDKDLCLIPAEVIAFVKDTQPKEYEQLSKEYGTDTDRKIVENVAKSINTNKTIKVLREGTIKDRGTIAFQIKHTVIHQNGPVMGPLNTKNNDRAVLFAVNVKIKVFIINFLVVTIGTNI